MLVSFPVQWMLSSHTGTELFTLLPNTKLENLVMLATLEYPICRQTTRASKKSQLSSHTVPHWPSWNTSTLPIPVEVLTAPLLTNRTCSIWPLSKVASVRFLLSYYKITLYNAFHTCANNSSFIVGVTEGLSPARVSTELDTCFISTT